MIKIALAGNPNSGKTTLFNALTGSNQFVGNWPGVTVEKKEGKYKKNKEVIITDLPGIYSLSPYTLEEVIARNYLMNENPDAILNIIDGTNIERNLYLTTQFLELGIPVVVAINMSDVVEKEGKKIDCNHLRKTLGCEVVEVSALKETGIQEAMDQVLNVVKEKKTPTLIEYFSPEIEQCLTWISKTLLADVDENKKRWTAIKLFEKDEKVLQAMALSSDKKEMLATEVKKIETKEEDDAESIIINDRYIYVTEVMKNGYTKKADKKKTVSEKIDDVVTNRWLALPIFAIVMFFVYYISVTSVGTLLTDWTNDVLFGEIVPNFVESVLISLNVAPWMQELILDGILAGVGAVLGFVPQMFVLFAFLAFLEACGYMARVAFIMDRIFRKFGLSGKSFIPMLIGTGCSVPAVMSSRTIESQRDRRMTIMTTPFVPCSAKLPIIALVAGALFGGVWWVAPSAYFVGIGAIVVSGIILKKTKRFAGDVSPFVMELPAYHWPTLKNLARSVWERGWSFIKKAGTIILLSSIVIWFLTRFGWVDGSIQMVDSIENGFLAVIGNFFAPIFAPLGFGEWKATVATFTGLVAKETVVSTFGILYGFGEVAEDGIEIWTVLADSFTTISAYAFLTFNLLCAPCFAAIGAIHREMNSGKWTLFALAYQTGFAYVIALLIYQLGTWATTGTFGILTAIACVLLVGLLYLFFRPQPKVRVK
ncbi:MAG: ferrous iron transport protein B [Anaerorhabdus sp.]